MGVIVEFAHQKNGPAPLIRGGRCYILIAEIAVGKSRKLRMCVTEWCLDLDLLETDKRSPQA